MAGTVVKPWGSHVITRNRMIAIKWRMWPPDDRDKMEDVATGGAGMLPHAGMSTCDHSLNGI